MSETPNTTLEPVAAGSPQEKIVCSFCGRSQHEVKKLIAGPVVLICNECVDLCVDILKEKKSVAQEQTAPEVLATLTEMCEHVSGMRFPPNQGPEKLKLGAAEVIVSYHMQEERRSMSAIVRASDLGESSLELFLSAGAVSGMPVEKLLFTKGAPHWLMFLHGTSEPLSCTVYFLGE